MTEKEYKRMLKKYSQTCDKLRELNRLAIELQRRLINSKR